MARSPPHGLRRMTNASLARTYANCGVPVFPCREVGERVKSPYTAKGFHDASADPDQLRRWRLKHPSALYGLSCAPNGLLVLDADRHGNGDGVANVMAVFKRNNFDWQLAPAVGTPREGMHFIFRKPVGLGKTKSKIAGAVDVRDNAYIIAPGNILPGGRRYELLNGEIDQLAIAIANHSLPLMPEWLIRLALQPTNVASALRKTPVNHSCASYGPATSADGSLNSLGGIIRAVIGAAVGERNRTLFWGACRLGTLVDEEIIRPEGALSLLTEAGELAGLARGEARATALSGLHQGRRDATHGR